MGKKRPNVSEIVVYFTKDEYETLKNKAGGMALRTYAYFRISKFLEAGNYTINPSPSHGKEKGLALDFTPEAYNHLKAIAKQNNTSLTALLRAILLG